MGAQAMIGITIAAAARANERLSHLAIRSVAVFSAQPNKSSISKGRDPYTKFIPLLLKSNVISLSVTKNAKSASTRVYFRSR